MELKYRKDKTYTVAPLNVVGATTNSIFRSVTVHNDSNCKYVAMNGNDTTGTGTSSLPYLTIEKAVTTLGGAFVIVTVIRNSYVGDLEFEAPDTQFPAGNVLQVELGEYAVLKRDNLKTLVSATGTGKISNDFAFYNGRWVAAGLGPYQKLAYSDDGINWTTSASPTHTWVGVAVYNGLWVAVTYDTDYIYYSNDGINWTVSSSPQRDWWTIDVDSSGLFVAGVWTPGAGTQYAPYYSTDGINWTLGNGPSTGWLFIKWIQNKWLAGTNGLYESLDGKNWNKLPGPNIAIEWIESNEDGSYWIKVTNKKLYYSYDLQNWFFLTISDPNTYFAKIARFGNLWVAIPAIPDKLWYSLDGKIFLEMANSTSVTYWGIEFNEFGFCQLGTNNNIEYLVDWIHYQLNNNCTVNGFIFDGKNLLQTGLLWNGVTTPDLWWSTFQNLQYHFCNDSDGDVKNSIFKGGTYGGYKTDATLTENLFHDFEEMAVLHVNSSPNIQNQTIVDCNTGLKLLNTITSTSNVKNNLIAYCSVAIQSVITEITLYNHLTHGDLIKVTLDNTSLDQVKPLFHDYLNDDFHIRHIGEDYENDSPGVGLGTSDSDVGCYKLNITLDSVDYDTIVLKEDRYRITRKPFPVNPIERYSISGNYNRYIEGMLNNYLVESKSGLTDDFYKIVDVMRYDKPMVVKPVSNGVDSSICQGTFSWLDKTKQNGLVEVKLTTYIEADLLNCQWIGNFLLVPNISGAVAPWDTAYPFKIINHERTPDGKHLLTLENYLDNYPGSGFASNPDGVYFCQLRAGMLALWLKYKGLENGVEKWEAPTTITYYGERNQWAGVCDLTLNRRIISNNDKIFYSEPVITPYIYPSIDTNYAWVFEFYTMKIKPSAIEPTPTAENWKHGKKGNDYFSTPASKEQHPAFKRTGFQVDNEKNWSVTLIECEETDFLEYL